MFGFLKKLFGTKPTVSPCPEVPYKVEKPEVVALGEPPATVVAEVPKQEEAKSEPKKKAAPKKPAGDKKAAPKKGGRKPKSKSQ